MQRLNSDLKNKTFGHIYLLYGEEEFLKQSYKNRLKTAMIGDDTINYNYYEGKNIDWNQVKGVAQTLPFFSELRLIIIENSGYFKSASEEVNDYLKELPQTTHIVFVESEVDKRNKVYKTVKDIGYIAELSHPSEEELSKWVLGILRRENKNITREALESFLLKTNDNMQNMQMELEKLISYTLNKDMIIIEDVNDICVEKIENRIFEMIEAMAGGNEKKAFDLYYDLLSLKEPSMRILFLIARQFNQLLQIKEFVADRVNKDEIAAKMKLRPFVVTKLISQARAFSMKELKDYVKSCVEAEEAIKTGNIIDKIAVEMIIVRISRRK